MFGAVEKQKLVYILNRDTAAKLTISSPLEAHRSHTVTYSLIGLDVGFNNPQFAALELDHTEADADSTGKAAEDAEKHLVIYELDLGLNHVVRKYSEPVDNRASLLIPVPGGADGPGGCLLCGEDFIAYHAPGHKECAVALPRRHTWPAARPLLVTAYAIHRQKNLFFFLIHTEPGDLYKVTLDYTENQVSDVRVRYFDSIQPATSICILRTGFLFAASEFGSHAVYQFQGLGDEEEELDTVGDFQCFVPHHPLVNLLPTDTIESQCPILDMKCGQPLGPFALTADGTPQMVSICGRGPRSSLRVVRHGMQVTEMAVTELPGVPTALWTVKTRASDKHDKLIVVSFISGTLVLNIGETVEEVADSGLLSSVGTLAVHTLGEDALVQVHSNGIRHIRADRRINEWKAPNRQQILRCAVNSRQVVIALPKDAGCELHYFELDPPSGALMEIGTKAMDVSIDCMDIGPIPPGKQRSRFLALGLPDSTVRVLSLDPEDCMTVLSVQAMQTPAHSLAIVRMEATSQDPNAPTLFLNIGRNDGVLLRTVLDPVTGRLSDQRHRLLGTRPPKLFKVRVQGREALLALSSKPWLGYIHQDRFMLTPLAYEALDSGSPFSSEACPEGIVATSASSLRIISLERLGEVFHQAAVPLACTPRRFLVHPQGRLVMIETDAGVMPEQERAARIKAETEQGNPRAAEAFSRPVAEFGMPRTPQGGTWLSFLRLMDPAPLLSGTRGADPATHCPTHDMVQFAANESAVSLGTVRFHDHQEDYVVVGTARDLSFFPRGASAGCIYLYRITTNPAGGAQRFELIHTTLTDEIPYAFAQFKGRLLVGMGPILRIYDLGKRRLLRKCENKNFPNFITTIYVQGDRIVVGDLTESFHIVRYRRDINQLTVFADNTTPRWLTAWCPLDYDTMAGADKFGNFFITRLPYEVADIEDDPTGWGRNVLNGAPYKMTEIAQFYVGEPITALQRATLGGMECIFYTTLMGSIGAFFPFASREELEFFTRLEICIRQLNLSLCGRDHLSFRSSYFPVKDVIDGDLCEAFMRLEPALQQRIAEEMDKPISEILKKLEDIRNRIL